MPEESKEKKRMILKIMGEEYVIRSTTSPAHMLEVGETVNQIMEDLAEKHPTMSLQKIAVLASLNLASDLLEHEQGQKKAGHMKTRAKKSQERGKTGD